MSMSGYTKLFNSILASTVWREPNHVRIVWITLLAMADKQGIAEGSVPGLADFARVSIDDCRDALRRLSDPDRDSRSQEHEGRRIVAVDGGWQLLNHAKYREKLSADERRAYLREKQREYRARSSKSTNVDNVSDTDTLYTHTSPEAEAEATPKAKAPIAEGAIGSPSPRGGSVMSPADYAKLQRFNAYVGARLRVPHKLHGDFCAALGGENPDSALRTWYAEVDAEIEASREAIVPDVWKWLEARFKPWASQHAVSAEMARFIAEG